MPDRPSCSPRTPGRRAGLEPHVPATAIMMAVAGQFGGAEATAVCWLLGHRLHVDVTDGLLLIKLAQVPVTDPW